MEGAKAALNNYSDSEVDRFNAMVADYNSRCGRFRYRSGALERARRDVEPYRGQLQAEGRSRRKEPIRSRSIHWLPVGTSTSTSTSARASCSGCDCTSYSTEA